MIVDNNINTSVNTVDDYNFQLKLQQQENISDPENLMQPPTSLDKTTTGINIDHQIPKTMPKNMNNVISINNMSNNSSSGGGGKSRPLPVPNSNNNNNSSTIYSPLPVQMSSSSPAITSPSPLTNNNNNKQQSSSNHQNEDISIMTGYYACSRYLLFIIYIILLLTLITNTFIHFIFYGSNMSIGSMFLDVHHRQELINGDYYSHENLHHHNHHQGFQSTTNERNYHQRNLPRPQSTINHMNRDRDLLYCDRNSFLSLLDEFYHQYPVPKPSSSSSPSSPFDELTRIHNSANVQDPRDSRNSPKSYPKIFTNFNNYARSSANNDNSADDEHVNEDVFYSSSSTSRENDDEPGSLKSSGGIFGLTSDKRHHYHQTHENRLLIIEVIALILLFVIVVNQVLGLIGVIRKHLYILIFVTFINLLLFCILAFICNIGLIILLLLTIFGGYFFIYQFKIGMGRKLKEKIKFKEDLSLEIQDAIIQMRNRMSPCVHVSMEQYEQMTQQMLHRYSSPIVYCPHYNESLC